MTDTCACDMRHPDDDSPFQHHPYCVARHADRFRPVDGLELCTVHGGVLIEGEHECIAREHDEADSADCEGVAVYVDTTP